MMSKELLALCLVLSYVECDLTFPPGLKFGAATASYQIEGAWNISDKTNNIWDKYTHVYPEIFQSYTGDVACDSYNQWQRDVEMAVELGLQHYRFSINWPRLLPSGDDSVISEDGRNYYNNLIDELIKYGIEPVVTLYHWETPVKYEQMGGWNNSLTADYFANYTRVVYSLFGDRVKRWLTINEPIIICHGLYSEYFLPVPIDKYACTKNTLLAHAKSWRIYDEEFRPTQHGQVSFTNQLVWYEPAPGSDEELAELALKYATGLYSHPVYTDEGGWPPEIEEIIAEYSRKKGHKKSLLPAFSEEEKHLVKGTFDYYALNHYSSRLVREAEDGEIVTGWPIYGGSEINAVFDRDPCWTIPYENAWSYVNPQGIRKTLVWLKKNYGDLEFFIAENGYSSQSETLDDDDRAKFHRDYLEQVLLAIKEDVVNVVGYTVWSLMDNFEWFDGYATKFGLYAVDFADPQRTRRPKKSSIFYANVIKHRAVVDLSVTGDNNAIDED